MPPGMTPAESAPPPGWRPPGYQATVPQPPRRRRRGLIIGLTIGAVLLLGGICGVAGIGGFIYLGYRIDKQDAVSALTQYLEKVRAKNYSAAYDQLCDDAKRRVTREEFGAQSGPALVDFRIGESSLADRGDDSGYDIKVDVKREDGNPRTETYFVFSKDTNLDRYYICPPGI
jgi:hypothetical protein